MITHFCASGFKSISIRDKDESKCEGRLFHICLLQNSYPFLWSIWYWSPSETWYRTRWISGLTPYGNYNVPVPTASTIFHGRLFCRHFNNCVKNIGKNITENKEYLVHLEWLHSQYYYYQFIRDTAVPSISITSGNIIRKLCPQFMY